MNEPAPQALPVAKLRLLPLVCTIAMALALVGYMVGLLQPRTSNDGGPAPKIKAHDTAVAAIAYLEQPRYSVSPNLNWTQRADLRQSLNNSGKVPPPGSLAQKREALAKRAERRAFDGAPPVIPHPINSHEVKSCLGCHQNGARIGDLLAPAMPHALLTSCTQCHAPPAENFLQSKPLPMSTFVGKASPLAGARASLGAPPMMPHPTHLRENCLSCHGETGKSPLRSSHPERKSCQQCHAPSAELDQLHIGPGFLPKAPR